MSPIQTRFVRILISYDMHYSRLVPQDWSVPMRGTNYWIILIELIANVFVPVKIMRDRILQEGKK